MDLDIPQQLKGAHTNTEHSVTANTKEEAHALFKMGCNRLLNINAWNKLCGTASADFRLINKNGEEDNSLAKENDYFKIDIPGLGPASGEGYDWVKVEKIEDRTNSSVDEESFLLRVRPSTNPNNDIDDIAHFLSDEATSSFVISRKDKTVTASVFGRNEVPNKNAEKVVDKIRNALVGVGAIAGGSKIQWKLLVTGLLKKDRK